MPEPMSVEQCREQQRACSTAVHAEVHELRLEVKTDIAAIREAVQAIDRAVSQIKGFLGLNGSSAATGPHPHRRDQEREEHLHRRITDLVAAMDRRNTEDGERGDWRVKVMWGVGVFLASALAAPILYAAGSALARRIFG